MLLVKPDASAHESVATPNHERNPATPATAGARRDADTAAFHQLREAGAQSVILLNADLSIQAFNPTAERVARLLFHKPLRVGDPILDFIEPSEQATFRERFARALQGQPQSSEHRFQVGEAEVWWEAFYDPLITSNDQLIGVTFTTRNISQRKRGERALRDSQAQYWRLVEYSPDAIAVHSQGKLVYVNRAAIALMGARDASDLLGKSVIELVHPDFRALALARIRQTQEEQREAEAIEERFIRLDGQPIDVLVSAIPTLYEGYPATQVVVVDISGLRRAEQALRDSEAQLRMATEAAQLGTWEYDFDARVTRYSDRTAEIYGRLADQRQSTFEMWVDRLHPDDRAQVLAEWQRAVCGEALYQPEFRIQLPDGTVRWIASTGAIVRNAAGQPRRAYGVASDISERKRAEEALRASEQRYRDLADAAQRQATELDLLNQARLALARETDLPRMMRAVVESIAQTFGYTQVSLYLREGETLALQHQVGYATPIQRIPFNQGVMWRVVRSGQPELLEDARADPSFIGAIQGIVSEVCVPLFDQRRVVGTLNVESTRGIRLGERDLHLMVALSEHISLAIERAGLYEEAHQQLHLQSTLREVAAIVSSSLQLGDVLHLVAAQLARAVDATSVYLLDVHPETETATVVAEYLGAEANEGERRSDLGVTYRLADELPQMGQAVASQQPVLLVRDDLPPDEAARSNLAAFDGQTSLDLPLIYGDQVFAVASLWDSRGRRTFTPAEIALCQGIAQHATLAILNARLYAQARQQLDERTRAEEALRASEQRARELADAAQRQASELALLNRARLALTNELELSEVIRAVVEGIAETFGYTQVSLYLRRGDVLVMQHLVGYDFFFEEMTLEMGVIGRTARTGQAVLIEDVRQDADFLEAATDTVSEVSVPLWDEGRVVGVLNVESTRGVRLGERDLHLMVALSEHISLAIGRARLYEAARQQLHQQRMLREAATVMSSSLELNDVLRLIAEQMAHALDVTSVYLSDFQPDAGTVTVVAEFVGPEASAGERESDCGTPYRVADQLPHMAILLASRQPYVLQRADPGLEETTRRHLETFGGHSCLDLPLIYRDEVIAAASLWDSRGRRDFSAAEIALCQGIAQHAALAIQNARLYRRAQQEIAERTRAEETLRRQHGYLAALHETSLGLINRLELSELLEAIITRAAQLVGTAHAFIYLLEPGGAEMEVKFGIGTFEQFIGFRIRQGQGMSGRAWETGEAVVLNDYNTWPSSLAQFWGVQMHASMGLPLRSGAQIVGVIGVVHLEEGVRFAPAEVELLNRFAQLASLALDNSRLHEALQQELAERTRAEEALRESDERYMLAVRGAQDGLWDWNLRANEVYFSPRWKAMLGFADADIGSQPAEWFSRVHPEDLPALQASLRAHLAREAPHFESEHRMRHADGSYRWMLTRGLAVRAEGGSAHRMAGSQSDITLRKRAEAQLLHDAFHDALTGLPNRALFMDRLSRAVERARQRADFQFAVLFLDLDRFKQINDSLGHMVGDLLLILLARRLERAMRPTDTVVRLGGDEFTILLEGISDPADATRVAQRVEQELALPFRVEGHDLYVSASIGIVPGQPGYERAEDVLRDADIAMYQAKARGRARHEVFHAAMHQQAMALLQLENDLRRAIERQEFALVYQPILALESGSVVAFEALLRWHHPDRGLVLPNGFLSALEETGLILPVGHWVLRSACHQLRLWQAIHPAEPPLVMCVNLSTKQLMAPEFVGQLRDLLAETGLNPRTLMVEVTESAVLSQANEATTALKEIAALGVGLHIDNFGIGHSSLSHLHRFPIDTLKVDRTFVGRLGQDGETDKIVQSIVTLAQSLGIAVIGEGIETAAQTAHLLALGCQYGQGHLFAAPLDAVEASALLGQGMTSDE